jgi:hypothetical protein
MRAETPKFVEARGGPRAGAKMPGSMRFAREEAVCAGCLCP